MFELSLSYFTSPLNIKLVISDELESVANIGFNLDGLVDVAKCKVDEKRFMDKSKRSRYFKRFSFLKRL